MVSSDTVISIICAGVFGLISTLFAVLGYLLIRNQGQIDTNIKELWKEIDQNRRAANDLANRIGSSEVKIERNSARISTLENGRKHYEIENMRLNKIVLFFIMTAIIGCGGGSGGDDDEQEPQPSVTAVSTVCVGGNTTVTVPDEDVGAVLEDEESEGDGDAIITEDAGPGVDQNGALRHFTRIIVIGDCNQIHTEDNDTSVVNAGGE